MYVCMYFIQPSQNVNNYYKSVDIVITQGDLSRLKLKLYNKCVYNINKFVNKLFSFF